MVLIWDLTPLLKPPRIHQVVIGNAMYFAFEEFLIDVLHFFSGNTSPDRTGLYVRIFSEHSPRSNDAIAFDHAVVHYNGAHADQNVIVHRAAVHDGVVAD